jgi:hypothetical protein
MRRRKEKKGSKSEQNVTGYGVAERKPDYGY